MMYALTVLWSSIPLVAWSLAGGIALSGARDWAHALGVAVVVVAGLPIAMSPLVIALAAMRKEKS